MTIFSNSTFLLKNASYTLNFSSCSTQCTFLDHNEDKNIYHLLSTHYVQTSSAYRFIPILEIRKLTLREVTLSGQGVAGRIRGTQGSSCPNPQNLWMVTLQGKRDMAGMIQLRTLRWGVYPGLSQESLWRRELGRWVRKGGVTSEAEARVM